MPLLPARCTQQTEKTLQRTLSQIETKKKKEGEDKKKDTTLNKLKKNNAQIIKMNQKNPSKKSKVDVFIQNKN